MCKSFLQRALIFILIFHINMLGVSQSLLAAPISTQTLLQLQEREARIERIEAALAREDVRSALVQLGVEPQDAQQRILALTDQELLMVSQQLDTLPAGGDALLAVIGAVFVVLIILELVGVTNVFSKV